MQRWAAKEFAAFISKAACSPQNATRAPGQRGVGTADQPQLAAQPQLQQLLSLDGL